MKILKHLLIPTLIFANVLAGFSQTIKTIDSLQNAEQNCLDRGQYMLGCAKRFYAQMDSMLNLVYLKLHSTLDNTKQVKLKMEQRLWLAKRNTYFKKTLKKFKDNNPNISPSGSAWGAQDDAMFMYDDNAAFVKTRIWELLRRINK
ncbi:MAG TPA: lysozyme inhibitor LprI family protein [Chitinophagaceae bacterium]|nr:lysozyme inhibitor LprI family protein [Chitinophagaceae bacterium]